MTHQFYFISNLENGSFLSAPNDPTCTTQGHATQGNMTLADVFLHLQFCNCFVPMGFLPWEIQVAFPRESQLRQLCYQT